MADGAISSRDNTFINNIKEIKNRLRGEYLALRKDMPKETKAELDAKITSKLLNSVSYRHANTVLCYYSTDIEIDTHKIIETALKDGKKVALPRCIPDKLTMNFHYIESTDDLELTQMGIYEPKADLPIFDRNESLSICIIPAVVFDKGGYRIGYGRGYYDRFLNGFSGAQIGIIYSSCITDKLPRGRYDCAVDVLITEKGIQALKL